MNVAAARAAGATDEQIIAENTRRGVAPVDSAKAAAAGATPEMIAAENALRGHAPAAAPVATASAGPPKGNSAIGSAPIALAEKTINGLMAGFGNSFAAAANQHVGGPPGEYEANLARYKASSDEDQRDHPVASGAGTLLGAVASPINKAVAPLGLLGGGAALGGLNSLGNDVGSNKSATARGIDAGIGAGVGGVTAGVLGTALKSAFGSNAAQRLVLAASKDGGVLSELQNLVAAGKGALPTLADLSPKLRDMLDGAASKSLDVAENVRNIVNGRDPGTMSRLANDLRAANPHTSFAPLTAQAEAMSAATRAADDANYGAIERSTGALPADELAASVSPHPAIMSVLKRGLLAGDIKNAPQVVKGLFPEVAAAQGGSQSIYQLLLAQGVPVAKAAAQDPAGAAAAAASSGRDLTFRDVQSFKQELDDHITSLFRQGKNNEALQVVEARDAVKGYLAQHAPGYAQADAVHSANLKAEDALAQGHTWFGKNGAEIEHGFNQMSPLDQDAARKGWAAAAIEHLSAKNPNADIAKAYANGDMQQQAKLMFGSEANFDKFMLNAKQEANLSRLASVNAGSQTARRLGGSSGDLGPMARFVTAQAHGRGLVSSALSAATPNFVRASTEAGARQVGDLLTTQGSDAITDLLAQLQGKQNVGNLFGLSATGAGGAAGGIAGGLLGSK